MNYVYSYFVDQSLDECIDFYTELLDDEVVTTEEDYAIVTTELDCYLYEASIEKNDDLIEMYITINQE